MREDHMKRWEFTMEWKKLIGLMMLVGLFSACVPVEKRAECSSGEAYNSSLRTCVPTIGSGSGSITYFKATSPSSQALTKSIYDGATNFSVLVADPYNKGFTIKWFLTFPNNTVQQVGIVGSDNISVGAGNVNSQVGNYVLEAKLFDAGGIQLLDTKNWFINFVSSQTPSIASIVPSRVSTVQTLTVGGNVLSFNASFTDNGYTGFNPSVTVTATWKVNGLAVASSTNPNTPASFNFDPATYGVGTHSVNFSLSGGSQIFDEVNYIVIVQAPNLVSYFDSAAPISGSAITVVDGVNIANNGFLIPDNVGGFTPMTAANAFCLSVTNFQGTRNIPGIPNTYIRYKLDGNLLNSSPLNFTGNGTANPKCITDVAGLNNFNISLPSYLQEIGQSKVLTAEVYDMGPNGQHLDDPNYLIKTVNWNLYVRPKNTKPSISTNLTIGDFDTGNINIVQDTDYTFAFTVADDDGNSSLNSDFEVRWYINGTLINGVNSFPNTNQPTPDCFHSYSEANDDFNQDTVTGDATGGLMSYKYSCKVAIPSFITSGSNNNTGYTLTAVVSDKSHYPGGAAKDSNTLTWNITLDETQTASQIADITTNTAISGLSTNDTYIEVVGISQPSLIGVAAGGVGSEIPETTDISLKIAVADQERDDYLRTIELCKGYSGALTPPYDPVLAQNCSVIDPVKTINRNNGDLWHQSSFSYRITESALVGALTGKIYFKVTIQDLPSTTQGTIIKALFPVEAINYNPQPVAVANSTPTIVVPPFTPESPLTNYNVYPGIPFSLDPGPVSDASESDGNNILYQWQICHSVVCTNSDWINIDGATERILAWTPSAELATLTTDVSFRLCIGDDGFGHEMTNCVGPTQSTDVTWVGPWQYFFVNKNQVNYTANVDELNNDTTPSGQVATWVNTTSSEREVYTVYSTAGSGAQDARIVISKAVYKGDGTGHIPSAEAQLNGIDVYSSSFYTDVNGAGFSYPADDITIAGDATNGYLYIVYKVTDPNTIPANISTIKVRRVKISNGLMGFSYTGIPYDDSLAGNCYITTPQGLYGDNIQLDFTTNDCFAGESIILNGAQLDISTIVGASGAATAQSLANYLNGNPALELNDRFHATVSGPVLTLTGYSNNDFFDANYYAKEIGNAVIDPNTNELIVPFVDGVNGDKISVFKIQTTANLGDPNNNKSKIEFNATPQAVAIENAYSTGVNYHFFAIKSASNHLYLYAYDAINELSSPYTTGSNTDIFTHTVSEFKIGAGQPGNAFTFIAGIDPNNSNKMSMIRIDESSFVSSSLTVYRKEPLDDDNRSQYKELYDFDIFPLFGTHEAILVSATNSSSDHDPDKRQKVYVSKIKSMDILANGSPFKLLNTQSPVNYSTQSLYPNHKVAIAGIDSGRDFGQQGAILNENISNEVVFLSYTVDDGSTIPSMRSSFINVEEENITVDSPSPQDGFQPGYVKAE